MFDQLFECKKKLLAFTLTPRRVFFFQFLLQTYLLLLKSKLYIPAHVHGCQHYSALRLALLTKVSTQISQLHCIFRFRSFCSIWAALEERIAIFCGRLRPFLSSFHRSFRSPLSKLLRRWRSRGRSSREPRAQTQERLLGQMWTQFRSHSASSSSTSFRLSFSYIRKVSFLFFAKTTKFPSRGSTIFENECSQSTTVVNRKCSHYFR